MSRQSEFESSYTKPATMYLQWSSEDKCFKHYNSATKQNELVELPLKFCVLKELHTVKGWHDKSASGIYANEVAAIGSETLEIKSFKGGVLAKGIYKEIKEIINNIGGVYYKSIYAMLPSGDVVNIAIKGASVKAWGDFVGQQRSRFASTWVEINSSQDEKKGRVSYSVPFISWGEGLNGAEMKTADDAYETLSKELNRVVNAITPIEDEDDDFSQLADEDVDF